MIIIYHSLNWFNMWYFYQINETIICIFIDLRDKLILKGSLDLIPSPSAWSKIQIISGKVCFGQNIARHCQQTFENKTFVNKLLKTKPLLTSPSNILPFYFSHVIANTYACRIILQRKSECELPCDKNSDRQSRCGPSC